MCNPRAKVFDILSTFPVPYASSDPGFRQTPIPGRRQMAAARSPEELSFDPSGAYRERRLHVGRMRQQEGRIRERGGQRERQQEGETTEEATGNDNRRGGAMGGAMGNGNRGSRNRKRQPVLRASGRDPSAGRSSLPIPTPRGHRCAFFRSRRSGIGIVFLSLQSESGKEKKWVLKS